MDWHTVASTADEFADQLDTVVVNILDKHCPLQVRQKMAPSRLVNRWLSDSAKEAERLRRRLERRWKSKGNKNDYVEYRRACRAANNEIITARSNFYKDRITEAAGDPRRRWSVIRDILHLTEVKAYHTPDDCRKLADAFSTFFVDKIRKTKELIKARRSVHDSIPLQHEKPAANSNLPLDH